MEQVLKEKLENGTADDIDLDMIASRCINVHNQLLSLLDDFTKKFEALTEEYEEEFKIGGISLAMGYTDKPAVLIHPDKPVVQIVYGRTPYLKNIMEQIVKEVAK